MNGTFTFFIATLLISKEKGPCSPFFNDEIPGAPRS